MLRSSATVQFVNDNDNNVNDTVNVVSTIEVCVWLRLWVICISSVWVSEQVRSWNNIIIINDIFMYYYQYHIRISICFVKTVSVR